MVGEAVVSKAAGQAFRAEYLGVGTERHRNGKLEVTSSIDAAAARSAG